MTQLITRMPEVMEHWINGALLAKRQGSLERFINTAVEPEFGGVVAQQMFDFVSNMDGIIHSVVLAK